MPGPSLSARWGRGRRAPGYDQGLTCRRRRIVALLIAENAHDRNRHGPDARRLGPVLPDAGARRRRQPRHPGAGQRPGAVRLLLVLETVVGVAVDRAAAVSEHLQEIVPRMLFAGGQQRGLEGGVGEVADLVAEEEEGGHCFGCWCWDCGLLWRVWF